MIFLCLHIMLKIKPIITRFVVNFNNISDEWDYIPPNDSMSFIEFILKSMEDEFEKLCSYDEFNKYFVKLMDVFYKHYEQIDQDNIFTYILNNNQGIFNIEYEGFTYSMSDIVSNSLNTITVKQFNDILESHKSFDNEWRMDLFPVYLNGCTEIKFKSNIDNITCCNPNTSIGDIQEFLDEMQIIRDLQNNDSEIGAICKYMDMKINKNKKIKRAY